MSTRRRLPAIRLTDLAAQTHLITAMTQAGRSFQGHSADVTGSLRIWREQGFDQAGRLVYPMFYLVGGTNTLAAGSDGVHGGWAKAFDWTNSIDHFLTVARAVWAQEVRVV